MFAHTLNSIKLLNTKLRRRRPKLPLCETARQCRRILLLEDIGGGCSYELEATNGASAPKPTTCTLYRDPRDADSRQPLCNQSSQSISFNVNHSPKERSASIARPISCVKTVCRPTPPPPIGFLEYPTSLKSQRCAIRSMKPPRFIG